MDYFINKKALSGFRVFALLLLSFLLVSCSSEAVTKGVERKVIVIGFDGMDPRLVERYMEEGIMPNFKALKEQGDFKPLTTSMPPQSPVAWSNFITGMNPGGHGIFDFIGRDPETYMPFLSTSKTIQGKRKITIGDLVIPFSRAETLLLRKGRAFWQILEEHGIPATVIKVPANFPPVGKKSRTLSGMGTPDILGTYGTFSFYTTGDVHIDDIASGRIYRVRKENNTIVTKLVGPPNPFRKKRQDVSLPMVIKIDERNPVALIELDGRRILLKEGEWSDWVRVEFSFLPTQKMSGIVRFFILKTHPDFEMYVSPINIDPENPAYRISTPDGYAKELADRLGYFYTQGMPEDTKALDQDILHNDDFLAQSDIILKERLKILDYELKRFKRGLLFFYFGETDLVAHMFWRYMDKEHPGYKKEEARLYSEVLKHLYKRVDGILGEVMKRIDDKTTLIVMSDHGFGPFRRYFNLNTWLYKNGYLSLMDDEKGVSGEFFENVDFSRTKAYALGFNALYINLRGREGKGIINPGPEKERLMDELIKRLEAVRDPKTGERVILKVYKREEIYSGRWVKDAPDLLIGYNRGYRASWETALGKVPEDIIGDNLKRWSGTHLEDYRLFPGIVFSNKKIRKSAPALYDLVPTILSEFDIKKGEEMIGSPIF